jgi:hypothetical protein
VCADHVAFVICAASLRSPRAGAPPPAPPCAFASLGSWVGSGSQLTSGGWACQSPHLPGAGPPVSSRVRVGSGRSLTRAGRVWQSPHPPGVRSGGQLARVGSGRSLARAGRVRHSPHPRGRARCVRVGYGDSLTRAGRVRQSLHRRGQVR